MIKLFANPSHNAAFHFCMKEWARGNPNIRQWFDNQTMKIEWLDDDFPKKIICPIEVERPDDFLNPVGPPRPPSDPFESQYEIELETHWYFLWVFQNQYARIYLIDLAFDYENDILYACRWRKSGHMDRNFFLDWVYAKYGLVAAKAFIPSFPRT